jgi:hypothetical protein
VPIFIVLGPPVFWRSDAPVVRQPWFEASKICYGSLAHTFSRAALCCRMQKSGGMIEFVIDKISKHKRQAWLSFSKYLATGLRLYPLM